MTCETELGLRRENHNLTITDVSPSDRTATDGQGEADDGDRRAGRGPQREGGPHRALLQNAKGDPGRSRGRRLPQSRRELHSAAPPGLPRRGGLGGDREKARLWPGRGAYRGGS